MPFGRLLSKSVVHCLASYAVLTVDVRLGPRKWSLIFEHRFVAVKLNE